jgi:hypothetical protein
MSQYRSVPNTRSRSSAAPLPRTCALTVAVLLLSFPLTAQEPSRGFAGGLFGVSTLSADGRSVTNGSDAALSLYKPENGLAVNVFAGMHVAEYFSLQANWIGNRNDITLVSSFAAADGAGYYEQRRRSNQQAVVIDGLLYFRRRDSTVRPYLGTGLGFVRFSSDEIVNSVAIRLTPPITAITSTRLALRSHVGIDLRIWRHGSFRYSFSETIGGNPISGALTPPGQRGLGNFQNLFGFVSGF